MWTLFVITFWPELNDSSMTRYLEFKTLWECNNAIEDIKPFAPNETPVCIQTSRPIPSPNIIY